MDFRYPKITGRTEREQLTEIKNYLFTLVDSLRFAFSGVYPSNNTEHKTEITAETNMVSVFTAIKGFIKRSAEIANAHYTLLKEKLSADYAVKAQTGEINGWTFEIQDGRYFAYGTFPITTTKTAEAVGGIYQTEAFSFSLPFAVENAALFLTAGEPFFAGTPFLLTAEDGTQTVSMKLYSAQAVAADTTAAITLFAVGMIAQEEDDE